MSKDYPFCLPRLSCYHRKRSVRTNIFPLTMLKISFSIHILTRLKTFSHSFENKWRTTDPQCFVSKGEKSCVDEKNICFFLLKTII